MNAADSASTGHRRAPDYRRDGVLLTLLMSLRHFLRDARGGATAIATEAGPRLTDCRNLPHRSKDLGPERLDAVRLHA